MFVLIEVIVWFALIVVSVAGVGSAFLLVALRAHDLNDIELGDDEEDDSVCP